MKMVNHVSKIVLMTGKQTDWIKGCYNYIKAYYELLREFWTFIECKHLDGQLN